VKVLPGVHLLRTRLAINLIMSLASVLFILLLIEIALRLFYPQYAYYPRYQYVSNEETGYSYRPGFSGTYRTGEYTYQIRTNSLGLRDSEIPPKPEGTVRILAMGDSFTVGAGVALEDTYLKVIERLANAQLEGSFEVVNGGTGGYGTLHELNWYRQIEESVRPDLVTLLVARHDANDNLGGISKTVKSGFLVARGSSYKAWLKVAAHYASYYTHVGHLVFDVLRRSPLLRSAVESRPDDPATISRTATDFGPLADFNDVDRGLLLTLELLLEFIGETRNRGQELVIILMPDDWPSEFVQAIAKETKVFHLGPGFEENGPESLIYPVDRHWNAKGHRVVGSLVYDFMVKEGILEALPKPSNQ